MPRHRIPEALWFGLALGGLLAAFFSESLFAGRVLSPADVLLVQASFRLEPDVDYEPHNRLLMDPVLQFQPWLEFNRTMIRGGRLPLWNPHAGCGAPHLANGQSAVFDPFHVILYLTNLPLALGWMAFGRLWMAGMGMFLLARAWGAGHWGRWFAGLVFPLCGFLVGWLLYPVTPAAIWLPWLLLATGRSLDRPEPRSAGLLALVVAASIFGGHIQTSAHALLVAALFVLWKVGWSGLPWRSWSRPITCWAAGIGLGLGIAAIQIVPLWSYLGKSPVWEDRHREMGHWWSSSRPRLLEAACTAVPYVYGSQRRGQPNLARALGVNNLNESAGGYAGLATLIWLAPLAVGRFGRRSKVRFLVFLVLVGALGAFRLPPVDNLLRALPVLDVTDNRRLLLWVAFGLTLLGGLGLDAVVAGARIPRGWIAVWWFGAVVMATAALCLPRFEPRLRAAAERRVEVAATGSADLNRDLLRLRAERQVRAVVSFLPRYYGTVALELVLLGALAVAARHRAANARWVAPIVLGVTVAELFGFGYGLNPSIDRSLQEREPPLIARLRERLGPWGRALGIGEELPPNVLMRFGLGDPRNYDSVELARSLDWFEPLYEPGDGARTSRRSVTWASVLRARDRLERSGVGAVVGASPPPADSFAEVERLEDVWVAWLAPDDWASSASGASGLDVERDAGRATIRVRAASPDRVIVRETWDPGWRARIDGEPSSAGPPGGVFLEVSVPSGSHVIELEYSPVESAYAAFLTLFAASGAILALTGWARF